MLQKIIITELYTPRWVKKQTTLSVVKELSIAAVILKVQRRRLFDVTRRIVKSFILVTKSCFLNLLPYFIIFIIIRSIAPSVLNVFITYLTQLLHVVLSISLIELVKVNEFADVLDDLLEVMLLSIGFFTEKF